MVIYLKCKLTKMKRVLFPILIISIFISCRKEDDTPGSILGGPDRDLELGQQVSAEIESNPAEYPIMPENTEDQKKAYEYLRNNIIGPLLQSDDINLADKFPYLEAKIIADDNVLNAFCTPGGFIYVYSGLIKYLEVEDHLVGVLGHEIAHAERRHSIKQLEKQYGVSIILSIIAGEGSSQLAQMAGSIAGTGIILKFSRSAESEADEFAVKYTSDTEYACNGVAGFFEKISEEGGSGPPAFLSTHPSPDKRVEDINDLAKDLGCNKNNKPNADYAQFKQWVANGL